MRRLSHFSEEPSITPFRPHVSPTSSERKPFVRAIDETHARVIGSHAIVRAPVAGRAKHRCAKPEPPFLDWACPRRLHAIEGGWLPRVRACRLFVYEFEPAHFIPKDSEAGYWVSREEVAPLSVTPMGDLLQRHVEAGIELRIVTNLWPLIDAIVASGLEFSIIRQANAQGRRQEGECG